MNAAGLSANDSYVLLTVRRLTAERNGKPVTRSAVADDMKTAGIEAARRQRDALTRSFIALAALGHLVIEGRNVRLCGYVEPVQHRVIEGVNLAGRRYARCEECHKSIERWPLPDGDWGGDRKWAARVKRFRKQHPESVK